MAVEGLTHGSEEADLLGGVVAWTILLSVLAHGLSAQPLAAWYARRLAAQQGDLPEMEDVPEVVRRQSGLLGHAPEESATRRIGVLKYVDVGRRPKGEKQWSACLY